MATTTTTTTDALAMRHAAAMPATFLSLLLGEFAGGASSLARYSLPLEFHRLCHHLFERGSDDDIVSVNCKRSGLDAVLHSSMTALSCLVGHVLNDDGAGMEESLLELGSCIVNATCDALSWELGAHRKWDAVGSSGLAVSLLRLPQRWRQTLINPEFLGAMIRVYLAVLSIARGPIFANEDEQGGIRQIPDGLMLGCSGVDFERAKTAAAAGGGAFTSDLQGAEIVDLVTIFSLLIANFYVQILSQLPAFPRYLSTLCTMGEWLLEVLAMHAEANVFV